MKTFYLNPLSLFGFAFIVVILLYSTGLSSLYLKGDEYLTYVMLTICISAVLLGFFFKIIFKKYFDSPIKDEYYHKMLFPNLLFVIFGFLLDCAASGTIPLLSIVSGNVYAYKDFGLKTFHVFYMGYMSAFSIVCFERYLYTKARKFFWYSVLGVVITILIMSRGAMMLLIIPMVLLYLSSKKAKQSSGVKKKVKIVIGALIFIYLFGYLGDKRMIASGYKNEHVIYDIGGADPAFEYFPSGFFWVYLYASSPYATLASQESYNNTDRGSLSQFISGSILPDFISKYTDPKITIQFQPIRLTPELTVGTGFAVAIATLGLLGITLLYIWFVLLSFFFAFANRNIYIKSTCAIMASAGVLMTFDNMLIFSSCVMQLIIITMFSRLKINGYYLL